MPPVSPHTAAFVSHVNLFHPATTLFTPRPPTPADVLALSFLLTAALRWRPDPAKQRDMVQTLRRLDAQVNIWESRELLDLALDEIPLQDLYASAPDDGCLEDHLAQELARWFKRDYMRWVDPIDCETCGGATESAGLDTPTADEQAGGAGRVELWKCIDCGRTHRFPRHNDLRTLMQTRRGRCGEFANVFMLFLRAVGLRARYVWCAEDHVWCEYWSSQRGKWIHVDPSEGKTDQPLLYALGWGKAFTYILAFGTSGARDVTLSYTPSLTLPKGRESIGERDLRRALGWLTSRRRTGLDEPERASLRKEDEQERQWERNWRARVMEEEERASREGREGRISGGVDWRKNRGEGVGGDPLVPVGVQDPPFFDLKTSPPPVLRGSASLTSTALALTPCSPSATGAAFLPVPLPSSGTPFVAILTFRITSPPLPAQCADGMALGLFVLPDGETPALGEDGAGMGYQGVAKKGWVVEVDTYQTEDRTRDPATPHISLHSPPHPHHRYSLACALPSALPPLTDARAYTLRVAARPGEVDVRLREGGAEGVNGDGWEGVCTSERVPVVSEGEGKAWVGVTASCGGFFEGHEVLDWKIWLLDEVDQEAPGAE